MSSVVSTPRTSKSSTTGSGDVRADASGTTRQGGSSAELIDSGAGVGGGTLRSDPFLVDGYTADETLVTGICLLCAFRQCFSITRSIYACMYILPFILYIGICEPGHGFVLNPVALQGLPASDRLLPLSVIVKKRHEGAACIQPAPKRVHKDSARSQLVVFHEV